MSFNYLYGRDLMSSPIHHTFIRALKKNEIDHVLSPTRAKYSWLNTKNRTAILEAVDNKKTVVTLEGLSWKKFSIQHEFDKIYISPTGTGAPYTPAIWLSVTKLRKELGYGS